MVAARLANMRQGERTDIEPSANWQKVQLSISQSDAANQLNASERSIRSAVKVEHDGDESLVTAVDAGKVKVSVTADVATSSTVFFAIIYVI